MRLMLPDGFKIQPHWHPKVENVTVISGTFNVGMGDKFDQTATREMPAGTFGFWPAGHETFRLGKGRHGPATSWHGSVDDYVCESIR